MDNVLLVLCMMEELLISPILILLLLREPILYQ